MAAKHQQTNPHVQMGDPMPAPAADQKSRNLTRERMVGYFEGKKLEAEGMEKPPKDLQNIDPVARAAQMVP